MKKNSICLIIIISFIVICNLNSCFATETIIFEAEKEIVEKNEEFEILITIDNPKIVAFTLNIYYDTSKIDYISDFENINFSHDRLIYVWFDENGGMDLRKNVITQNLEFKAKEMGEVSFIVRGEFYGIDGNEIKLGDIYSNISIVKDKEQNLKTNNTYLNSMSLDYEGITPNFDKNVFEYYINVPDNLNSLKVSAIPENNKAQVNIKGNASLTTGLNTIVIEVISEDRSKKQEYKVFVTKTSNLDSSNTNIETLSIKEGVLYPNFVNQITHYNMEIENNIQKINILAITENPKASVKIKGNKELIEGNNQIEITVLAENGITQKTYIIDVYRRNLVEDLEKKENEEKNKEKLNKIIEEKGISKVYSEEKEINELKKEELEKEDIELEKKGNKENVSNSKSKKDKAIIVLTFVSVSLVLLIVFKVIKSKK